MPFRLGPWEIGLILVIILIVFGVGKLPQIGNAFGKTIREFRKSSHEEGEEEPQNGLKASKNLVAKGTVSKQ